MDEIAAVFILQGYLDSLAFSETLNGVNMEKSKVCGSGHRRIARVFVVEETKVGGTHYLLATEEEDGDCDAYILKEVETKDEESVYVLVEDDTELSAIGKVFAELLDDADIAF